MNYKLGILLSVYAQQIQRVQFALFHLHKA